jgi:uncharacterized BrkB/YihY/UPF0761 family membrane protein
MTPAESNGKGLAGGIRRAWRDHGRRALARAALWVLLQVMAALVLLTASIALWRAVEGMVIMREAVLQALPKTPSSK